MSSIYILKLEGGKYYIGKSGNVERRFHDHMSGNGSVWTRLHHPIELEKVISNTSAFDEDRYVKEYMSIHGIDNVRGGSYTTVDLSEEQKAFLTREIWGAQDLCARCGQAGHFIRHCNRPPPSRAQDLCARCGEAGHFILHCNRPPPPLSPISIPRSRQSTPESLPETLPEETFRPPTPLPVETFRPPTPLPVPPPLPPRAAPLVVEIPPTLTIPNPVFVIKNWFDTSFAKIQNEFMNPDSDLRSGRAFKKNT